MQLILIMGAGILAGLFFVPKQFKKWNERLQTVCTVILIFLMGVALGNREGFFKDLSALGLQSLLFAVIPGAASTWFVYVLTKHFFKQSKKKEKPVGQAAVKTPKKSQK